MRMVPIKCSFPIGKGIAILFVALLAVQFVWSVSLANAAEVEPYTIAVIPSTPTVAMHAKWSPLLERLTEKTGQRFELKLYERMAEFERDIGDGIPEFIFASPIQTVIAYQMQRYVPLVRGGKAISVGLFVRKDSPIRSIEDLTGKTISFVGNKNLCSVFIRHLLAKQGKPLSYESTYAGSTSNVIKSVLLGKSTAGAVFLPELERESVENRNQLRSIVETPKIAPHPLSAHPRVPQPVREKVKKAILEIASDKEGAELLRSVRLPAPVAADYRQDYRSLELIDVKSLTDWGK